MYVGIDLGTTFSVGAYVDENGDPHVIENSEGAKLTPSVVLFDRENEIVVGSIAKESSYVRAQDTIVAVKNHMGKRKSVHTINEKEYSPEMISSFIIRKIVKDAERKLAVPVTGVVITVPAYFTDAQRKATEDSAKIAGVNLLGMINEPTASALCYIHDNKVTDENILVYDLGGGTFDVTVLNVDTNGNINVKSTGGLSSTGGVFFDQCIVDYVHDQIEEQYEIDLEDEEYLDELQELYSKAENAKIQLSYREETIITLKIDGNKASIPITRTFFEDKIKKMYLRTESKMQEAIKKAGLEKGQIDKVVLVGGSSKIPYIEKSIKEFIGIEPCHSVNPDEAVALGAALYCSLKQENHNEKLFTDVCSHSIGVVVTEMSGEKYNEVIINKNSSLPVKSEPSRFRTIVRNQKSIDLTITEGEYMELSDVSIIGAFQIALPNDVPKGSLILITIELDQYQLVHVQLTMPDAGVDEEYRIQRKANMTDDEVANVTGILKDYSVS